MHYKFTSSDLMQESMKITNKRKYFTNYFTILEYFYAVSGVIFQQIY